MTKRRRNAKTFYLPDESPEYKAVVKEAETHFLSESQALRKIIREWMTLQSLRRG